MEIQSLGKFMELSQLLKYVMSLSYGADSRVVWKCVILMIIIDICQPIVIDQDIPNENKAPGLK